MKERAIPANALETNINTIDSGMYEEKNNAIKFNY